jgi:hypothetical protein
LGLPVVPDVYRDHRRVVAPSLCDLRDGLGLRQQLLELARRHHHHALGARLLRALPRRRGELVPGEDELASGSAHAELLAEIGLEVGDGSRVCGRQHVLSSVDVIQRFKGPPLRGGLGR